MSFSAATRPVCETNVHASTTSGRATFEHETAPVVERHGDTYPRFLLMPTLDQLKWSARPLNEFWDA